jgi:hypothetical protein
MLALLTGLSETDTAMKGSSSHSIYHYIYMCVCMHMKMICIYMCFMNVCVGLWAYSLIRTSKIHEPMLICLIIHMLPTGRSSKCSLHVCLFVCEYIYIYIYIYIYTYSHTHAHNAVYIYIYICLFVCEYIYIYIFICD